MYTPHTLGITTALHAKTMDLKQHYVRVTLYENCKSSNNTSRTKLLNVQQYVTLTRTWKNMMSLYHIDKYIRTAPIPVAARSKAWVCGRSHDGFADSNPAGNMDVCL